MKEFLTRLLANRGVSDLKQIEQFLHPNYAIDTHDPFLLSGMDEAVSRITNAVKNDEHVVIYADYDHDGIPGAVVLSDFFKQIGYTNYEVYIPHRNKEGFSLNVPALDTVASRKTKLLITIDCGITNVSEVKHANNLGIDVIITDHHLPKDKLPEAYAIVNPKKLDDGYPFKDLCGSGVILKVVQALVRSGSWNVPKGWEEALLDMVAIATLSDMVPLVGENRTIASVGLRMLRKSTRPGIRALMKVTKLNQAHLSEDDVVFMITPRINAASRMDVSDVAFQLLSSDIAKESDDLARALDEVNEKRKVYVAHMTKGAHKKISLRDELPKVVVIGHPSWNPGLVGLVAQSVSEQYGHTFFVWGSADGVQDKNVEIKGSCRSAGDVSVVELMNTLPEGVLTGHGGHRASGGFSTNKGALHTLEEKLNDAYDSIKTSSPKKNEVAPDMRLSLDDVTWEIYAQLEQLAPFGLGNPKPLFLFENATVHKLSHMGRDKNHLLLTFQNSDCLDITAMGFFMTKEDFGAGVDVDKEIDLLANIEKSTFRGRPELRLRIVDIL